MSYCCLLVACWCIYGQDTPPDDVLAKMEGILVKLEEMYEGEMILIRSYNAEPDGLDSERIKWIRREMREAGLSIVSLSCSEHSCLSVYDIDRGFIIFGDYIYYKYDSDSMTEEIIVDSVEKAIEENTEVNYAFCERTEAEHWFYCENNH